MLARTLRALALLSAAGSLAAILSDADFSTTRQMAVAAGFGAWACLPFALAWVAAGRLRGHALALLVLAAGLLAAAGFGAFVYASAYILTDKPEAQAGLVFLAVPLYQLGAVLVAVALAFLISRLGGPK